MFKFAASSKRYLKECDKDLQAICKSVKIISELDFDISCGYRSLEDQKAVYNKRLSKCDGVRKKSKHNYIPSRAVDIYCYDGDKADYSKEKLSYMAGLFRAVSIDLHKRGIIKNELLWGGWWNDLKDMPHYELI